MASVRTPSWASWTVLDAYRRLVWPAGADASADSSREFSRCQPFHVARAESLEELLQPSSAGPDAVAVAAGRSHRPGRLSRRDGAAQRRDGHGQDVSRPADPRVFAAQGSTGSCRCRAAPSRPTWSRASSSATSRGRSPGPIAQGRQVRGGRRGDAAARRDRHAGPGAAGDACCASSRRASSSRSAASRRSTVTARLIVASNLDLEEAVERGKFRPDLYFRLNVMSFHLPPLRERVQDIAPLARGMAARFNRKFNKELFDIHPEALAGPRSASPGRATSASWRTSCSTPCWSAAGRSCCSQHLPPPVQDQRGARRPTAHGAPARRFAAPSARPDRAQRHPAGAGQQRLQPHPRRGRARHQPRDAVQEDEEVRPAHQDQSSIMSNQATFCLEDDSPEPSAAARRLRRAVLQDIV